MPRRSPTSSPIAGPQRRPATWPRARLLARPAGRLERADQQVERAGGLARRRGHPRAGDRSGVADLESAEAHGGIHSGGMVICDRPIADVCPVEWARMENRSVLQWDKDDCAAIGLVKFDMLGAWHALGAALCHRLDRRAQGHRGRPGRAGPVRARGVRDAAARRLGRGVPGGVARADGHAAPAQAAGVLRPGGGGRPDPAGADPGQLGAPYINAAQRCGAGNLRPSVDGTGAAEDVGGASVSGAADAVGGGLCRLLGCRGRSVAPCHGIQAVHREDARASGPVLRRHAYNRHGITGEVAETGSTTKLEAFANFGFPESHSLSLRLCWCSTRRGSSCTIPRCSARRCCARNRWASTRRSRWSPMPAGTATSLVAEAVGTFLPVRGVTALFAANFPRGCGEAPAGVGFVESHSRSA